MFVALGLLPLFALHLYFHNRNNPKTHVAHLAPVLIAYQLSTRKPSRVITDLRVRSFDWRSSQQSRVRDTHPSGYPVVTPLAHTNGNTNALKRLSARMASAGAPPARRFVDTVDTISVLLSTRVLMEMR
jgi:hypothetical protein